MSYPGSAVVVDYYTRPGTTPAGNFADLFIDNSGNIYATYCSGDKRAFKLTLAGNTWSSTDIIAPATYNCPVGITVLPNGDIYLGIQDNFNYPSVFKIPAGTSLPTATSGSGFQGIISGITCPGNFAFDPTYSTMYVSCGCASKIYTVDMGTLAVTSTSAQLFNVYGIATDAQGAIYVAATTSGVYKIANPKVSMNFVRLANINTPQNNIYIIGVCVDKVANVLYAVDNNNNNIYKVNPTTGDYVLFATWTGRQSARCVVDKAGYVYIASNTDGYIGRLEPASSFAMPLTDASLLWHYRFEAGDVTGTTVANRVTGGASATVQGGAQRVATGSPSRNGGGYLNIATGSQYLQLPGITVTASSVFTLSFWIQPSSSWTKAPKWPQIFSMLTSAAFETGFTIAIEGQDNLNKMVVFTEGNGDYSGPSFTSYIDGNQWFHVALVFGATVKPTVYVNGVFANTFATSPFLTSLPKTYTIVNFAACPWPGDANFFGGLDDLMLFSRQLTTTEIAALSASA